MALGFAVSPVPALVGTARACDTTGSWGSLGCSGAVLPLLPMGQDCCDERRCLMLLELLGMSQGSPLSAGPGAEADLLLTFPVASKGLPRCGAVWGLLNFQWFWSLAGLHCFVKGLFTVSACTPCPSCLPLSWVPQNSPAPSLLGDLALLRTYSPWACRDKSPELSGCLQGTNSEW